MIIPAGSLCRPSKCCPSPSHSTVLPRAPMSWWVLWGLRMIRWLLGRYQGRPYLSLSPFVSSWEAPRKTCAQGIMTNGKPGIIYCHMPGIWHTYAEFSDSLGWVLSSLKPRKALSLAWQPRNWSWKRKTGPGKTEKPRRPGLAQEAGPTQLSPSAAWADRDAREEWPRIKQYNPSQFPLSPLSPFFLLSLSHSFPPSLFLEKGVIVHPSCLVGTVMHHNKNNNPILHCIHHEWGNIQVLECFSCIKSLANLCAIYHLTDKEIETQGT